MNRIVVVGSINTDLVVRTERIPRRGETVHGTSFRPYPGGKVANQAVAIAKLAHPITLIGKLGGDRLGDELLENLIAAGVECTAIGRTNGSSGIAIIITEESGENSIVVVGGANEELGPEDILQYSQVIQSAGIVLLQLEIPLATIEAVSRIACESNVPVMLDPAPAAALPKTLLERITWLTPNETEIGLLLNAPREIVGENDARDLAEQLLASGVKNVIIKMGAKGSYLALADGLRSAIPSFSVKAIDTTAAGDAYNAGFAVALIRGMTPQDAAVYASAAAAISVTREGAQPSMANSEEVRQLLKMKTEYPPLGDEVRTAKQNS